MGLSFLGPARDQPWVDVVRVEGDGVLRASMRLTLEEIDALHAHIHQDDPKPKVDTSLPPWCPTFDALNEAKGCLRRIPNFARHSQAKFVIALAQQAMDHLGGGGILADPLDLDDDGGAAESSAAEDAEAQQRRTER